MVGKTELCNTGRQCRLDIIAATRLRAATVGVCVKIYFFHKYENSLLAKQSVLQNVS